MKVREVLDTAKANMAASHKEVVKAEPECDALNEGFGFGVTYVADKFRALLDAEVYGFDTGAEAPTAIVETALREKAIREGWLAYHHAIHAEEEAEAVMAAALFDTGVLHESYKRNMGALVDAVLSTVLGHVRYAKEVGEFSDRIGGPPMLLDGERWHRVSLGDTVAILEEAGKEE